MCQLWVYNHYFIFTLRLYLTEQDKKTLHACERKKGEISLMTIRGRAGESTQHLMFLLPFLAFTADEASMEQMRRKVAYRRRRWRRRAVVMRQGFVNFLGSNSLFSFKDN